MSFYQQTKLIKLTVSAFAIGTLMSFSTMPSLAAGDEKTQILIVDTQVIMEKSTAILKVKEQLEKKAEEFKKDSTSKDSYFKKKYEELEKQKSVLAKDIFEQKNNDLTKEFGDAQKKVQDSRNSLDKAYTEAMQQFEKVLTEIIKDEAVKANAKTVQPKAQFLYSDPSLDVTPVILESLNKKLSNITVKF